MVESPSGSAALAEGLRRSGLTAAQLARHAGVSRALVRSYLSGAHQPSIGQLDRLLRAAGQRLELVVHAAPAWVDPGERRTAHHRRSPQEQGDALLDVLSLADAIPARRRTELAFPSIRRLTAS